MQPTPEEQRVLDGLRDLPVPPCIVQACEAEPGRGVLFLEDANGRRAFTYGVCDDHALLPEDERDRWIRRSVEALGGSHLLPEGFGR